MRKRTSTIYLFFAFFFILFLNFESNPPNGHTGAPGEGTCANCHSPASASIMGFVSISGLPGTIQPDTDYPITVTITKTVGSPQKAGFQLVALNSSNQNVGSFTSLGPNVDSESSGGRTYVEHSPAQNFVGNSVVYTFTWHSPAGPAGQIISMYAAGNLVNGNGNTSGDRVVTIQTAGTLAGSGPPLTVSIINSGNVSCNGGNNGFATALATGGTTPYTFTWSNGDTGPTADNLMAGNYTVSVSDGSGGMSTAFVVISQPSPINITLLNQTGIDCNNPNGSASVIASGGTPGFSYVWSTGATGTTANNLVAGINSVTATDLNGCTRVFQVNISSNTNPPVAEAGSSAVLTCTNTQINLNGAGSSIGPNFSYQWTTSNGNIVSGEFSLNPVVNAGGQYTLTVFNNSNGCNSSDIVTVTSNQDPPAAIAGPDAAVSCASPSIQLNGNGSATGSGISYNWTTPNGNIVNGATTLMPTVNAAGTYILTVNDVSNGCFSRDTAIVSGNNDVPVADAGVDAIINCLNATATLDGSNSSAGVNFSYEWTTDDGSIVSGANTNSPVVDGAGSYILNVMNTQNGCAETDTVLVAVDTLRPVADAGPDVVLYCTNLTDTLNGEQSSSGVGIIYLWGTNGGNILSGAFSNRAVIDAPGLYFITVTDTLNGCLSLDSVLVTEVLSPEIINTVVDHVDCFGGADGSISVEVAQGLAPFVFEWSNGADTNVNTNLSAGMYTLVVTDSLGCTDTASFTINQPANIVSNIGSIDESGVGANDGIAFVNPAGGTGVLSVLWQNGETTDSIFNLIPGEYFVSITDENNCQKTDSVVINNFNCGLAATLNSEAVTCFGASDGSADIVIISGTAPFEYLWNTGDTTATILAQPAGNYTVTVSDANNCVIIRTIAIGSPDALQIENSIIINVDCFGNASGSVEVVVSGGTAPYDLLWSNGETDDRIENLEAGVYPLTCTDANDCVFSTSFTINEPPALDVQIAGTNETAVGAADGTLSASVSGGTQMYHYLWNTGDTTATLSGLSPGIYLLSVTDENGCVEAADFEIFPYDCSAFGASFDFTEQICPSASDGQISISEIFGGREPYLANWSTGDTSLQISNLEAGDYQVSISDDAGCEIVRTFSIQSGDDIAPVIQQDNYEATLDENGVAELTEDFFENAVSDNCALDTVFWSRSTFGCDDLGSVKIELTAIDAAGNMTSDSVEILITDKIAPEITCPENIVTQNCGALDYDLPQVSDNCMAGVPVLTTGLPSGSVFPEGTTIVTYKVTDLAGLEAQCSFDIEVQNTLELDTLIVNFDDCLPTPPEAVVSGGTIPYVTTFDLDESDSVLVFTVNILDSNSCRVTAMIPIEINNEIEISVVETIAETEPGTMDGRATVDVSGGNGDLTFEWTNENGEVVSNTQNLTNVSAGEYQLTVTDEHGCEHTISVVIDLMSATSDLDLQNEIVLFPNPNPGKFFIQIKNLPVTKLELTLLDLNGKVLVAQNQPETERGLFVFEKSGLSEGIYFIKLIFEDQVVMKKFYVAAP